MSLLCWIIPSTSQRVLIPQQIVPHKGRLWGGPPDHLTRKRHSNAKSMMKSTTLWRSMRKPEKTLCRVLPTWSRAYSGPRVRNLRAFRYCVQKTKKRKSTFRGRSLWWSWSSWQNLSQSSRIRRGYRRLSKQNSKIDPFSGRRGSRIVRRTAPQKCCKSSVSKVLDSLLFCKRNFPSTKSGWLTRTSSTAFGLIPQ